MTESKAVVAPADGGQAGASAEAPRRRITMKYIEIREALEKALDGKGAVLASEVAKLVDAEGLDVVAVARTERYAVRRLGRVYVVGRSEDDIDRFIEELKSKALEKIRRLTAGCRSRMCCVRARSIAANSVYVSLYVHLLRDVGVIYYTPAKGYRICVRR